MGHLLLGLVPSLVVRLDRPSVLWATWRTTLQCPSPKCKDLVGDYPFPSLWYRHDEFSSVSLRMKSNTNYERERKKIKKINFIFLMCELSTLRHIRYPVVKNYVLYVTRLPVYKYTFRIVQ